MPLTLSDAQQVVLVTNVILLVAWAAFAGFWVGTESERKFRDKIDAIHEGREDANGREGGTQ